MVLPVCVCHYTYVHWGLCKYHLHLIAWSAHCFSLHIYWYMELKAGQSSMFGRAAWATNIQTQWTIRFNWFFHILRLASIHFGSVLFIFPFELKKKLLCIWSVLLFYSSCVHLKCCAWINPCWLKDTHTHTKDILVFQKSGSRLLRHIVLYTWAHTAVCSAHPTCSHDAIHWTCHAMPFVHFLCRTITRAYITHCNHIVYFEEKKIERKSITQSPSHHFFSPFLYGQTFFSVKS